MEEELIYSDNLYSSSQLKVLFVLPIISGTLSLLASLIVIYVILSDWKRKLQRVYHRVLLGFCIIDVMVSFNYALSSMVVPIGTPGVFGAKGNWATCQASGFFLQFVQSEGLYTSFLCIYYLLMVKYHALERTVARKVEPFIHAVAYLAPLGTAILMVNLDMYNPTNIIAGHCFINCYPANCKRVDGIECQRGENYYSWSLITSLPYFIYFLVIIITSVLTYRSVRDTERQQNRWSFPQSVLRSNSRDSDDNEIQRFYRSREENTRQAFIQTILYIFSFFITYGAFGISTFAPLFLDGVEENRSFYFATVVLVKIFLPSGGVWSFCIYMRPRLVLLKKRNPDTGYISLLGQAIFHSAEAPHARRTIVHGQTISFSDRIGRFIHFSVQRPEPPREPEQVRPLPEQAKSLLEDDNLDRDFTPELFSSDSPDDEKETG